MGCGRGGGDDVPIRDPEKQRRANTGIQRRKRSGCGKKTSYVPVEPIPLRTAGDVRAVIEEQVNLVRASDGDVIVRARAVARLLDVCLRAIEVSDIEARLAALEERIGHVN